MTIFAATRISTADSAIRAAAVVASAVLFSAMISASLIMTNIAHAAEKGEVATADEAGGDIAFVRGFGEEVVALLRQDALSRPEGRRRLRALLIESVDFETIGQITLGRHWRSAAEAQRVRYLAAYPDHLLRTYGNLLRQYSGQTLAIVSSRPVSGGDRLVEGKVHGAGGPPVDVAFRVRAVGDAWKIIDVSVERISLIVTQRSEFASVIQREGVDGLLAWLESPEILTSASNL